MAKRKNEGSKRADAKQTGAKSTAAKKHNLQWVKQTLELSDNHAWKSQEGYKVFVAGHGAVRLVDGVGSGGDFNPRSLQG